MVIADVIATQGEQHAQTHKHTNTRTGTCYLFACLYLSKECKIC